MSRPARPETALVGAGRLARALIPSLAIAGYPIVAVCSRRLAAARAACRGIRGARATTDPAAAARDARLLLLAVPDRVVAVLARALAVADGLAWSGRVVLHHAGSLGPEPLRPLSRAGASVGLLHPLQTLGDTPLAGSILSGSRARVEGEPRALAVATRLARDLGLVALPLRALSAGERAAYHAAASLLSNDLVALVSEGARILESLGLGRRAAIEALAPLARGTLAQIEGRDIERALTGPVVRGDAETLARQLSALGRRSRSAEAIHRLLSARLLDIARTAGQDLPEEARQSLRALLRGGPGTGRTV